MGKKEKLPNRFSKTFQFTRFEKLNLPLAPITEGVTPDNALMSISTVQCTMDQWGSYINLSDVAVITAKHPALQEGIRVLAEQATETIDRECIKLLLSNANVNYAGTATSRGALGTTDYVTTAVVKEAVSTLRAGGAIPVTGRLFLGLMAPSVEMDLLADSTFQTASSYSNIVALFNGEAGTWMGVRWMVSNLLPFLTRLTTPTIAGSATAGSLTNSTTYYFKVSAVNNSLGFETSVTVEFTQATGTAQTSIDVTMPATAGFTYNVYCSATTTTEKLFSSANAPSAVVNVGTMPSTGAAPPATPAAGVTVHFSWVIGMEAFAVPELQSLETFLTPDVASDSDPLKQRRKAGWKCMFKPVICNDAYIQRIESSSGF
jgi:N4-gp56 family major capsid protein